MKILIAIAAALLQTGCATVNSYTMDPAEPAWPQLQIREHPDEVSFCWGVMPAWRKALQVVMLALPAGCAWINLCEGTCDVYYPSHELPCADQNWGCMSAASAREHEISHCKGQMHPSDKLNNPHYTFWKNGGCNGSY